MLNLNQISSIIYNNTPEHIDTEIISGHCPDDTIKITSEHNADYMCWGFDVNGSYTLLGTYYSGEDFFDGYFIDLEGLSDDEAKQAILDEIKKDMGC